MKKHNGKEHRNDHYTMHRVGRKSRCSVRRLALIGSHGELSTLILCGALKMAYGVRKYGGRMEKRSCVHNDVSPKTSVEEMSYQDTMYRKGIPEAPSASAEKGKLKV